MKTVKEMYEEVNSSEELQKELSTAEDMEEIAALLKKHDCFVSAEKFLNYVRLNAVHKEEGELSDDDAATAAGGWHIPEWYKYR